MGALMSGMKQTMEDNFKKSQDFMLDSQKKQVERQLHMQMLMRERAMATQLARAREMAYWYGGFYGVASFLMVAGFMKTRHPGALVGLVPLSFVLGYQLDMAFGNKMDRIIAEADQILENEQNLLRLPGEPLNFEVIDASRKKSAKSGQ